MDVSYQQNVTGQCSVPKRRTDGMLTGRKPKCQQIEMLRRMGVPTALTCMARLL